METLMNYCPSCQIQLITDLQTYDVVCPNCGRVHDDGHLVVLPDPNGPAPMAVMPGGKRVRLKGSMDRHLLPAASTEKVYRALERQASSLHLSRQMVHPAHVMIRRAAVSFKGTNFNLVATAALYLEARQRGMAPSLRQYSRDTGFSSGNIWRMARLLAQQNHQTMHPVDPMRVAMLCLQETNITRDTLALVRAMIKDASNDLVGRGMSPRCVAAGAYYSACVVTGQDVGRKDATALFGVSPAVIKGPVPHYIQWLSDHGYNDGAIHLRKRLEGRKRRVLPAR